MDEVCRLREANGINGIACDKRECIYRRAAEHLEVGDDREHVCALQHFELLGPEGSEIASWLLSVKERVESLIQLDTEDHG